MSFLNNQHKFIYIHIPKTGGVSLTRLFYESGIRNDLDFGMGPKTNQLASRLLKRLPVVPVPKKPGIGRLKAFELILSGHLSASDFAQNINDFGDYSVFAVVRNPFAWLVSIFTFVNYAKKHPYMDMNPDRFATFENFIQYQCKKPGSQLSYIRNSCGRIDDVTVFKLETISEHLSQLSSMIGVELVGMKRENISNDRHYSEFYTKKLKQMVEKAYRSDLDELGYEFSHE